MAPGRAQQQTFLVTLGIPRYSFHPTDEELVLYYLKRKICKKKLQLDVIAETDVYKCDPEELPGLSLLKTGDRQWFFFTRKYPNGGRSNRATRHGYWKATGKDRNITCNNRSVGLKMTLVFYKGRAPTVERTDWVMHEYTVDEEDLKRYRNAQEYYALYKLFKKSAPGPKNGEQYGAPFLEEEWADDECPVMNNSADREISVDHVGEVVADCNAKPFGEIPLKQVEQITSNGFANTNSEPQSTVDELDEFMKQIAECDAVLDLPQIDDIIQSLSQVVSEEETQSTVVDLYSGEVNHPQSHTTFYPSVQQGNEYASFDFNRSATSQVQLYGASEASAPDFNKREPFTPILREEDFLEMDDLLGPEPTISNAGNSSGNLQFDEADGFDYHDAAMFFNSMEPMDQGNVSNQFMNSMDDNVLNQFDYQIEPSPLQINPQLNEGSTQINNQLWVQNDWQDTYASVESINGSGPQFTSGVVHESSNQPPQGNPNQSGNEAAGVTSQLSSALWSFVESIPTTPASASASESALVNLAFQRMSSFSKMRLINVPVSKDSENIRESRKRLFFVLPVVALCAIFWVVMSSARQWGRCIS